MIDVGVGTYTAKTFSEARYSIWTMQSDYRRRDAASGRRIGLGSFLVAFAISRTSPALVEAISGLRYFIVFLAAYAITRWKPTWFKEDFRGWTLVAKIAATCWVISGLVLLGLHGGHAGSAAP